MRIREARMRDASSIVQMLPETEKISEKEVMDMIQKGEPAVYVGTDFGANILGCAFGSDKIYLSSNCLEANAAEELKGMYK